MTGREPVDAELENLLQTALVEPLVPSGVTTVSEATPADKAITILAKRHEIRSIAEVMAEQATHHELTVGESAAAFLEFKRGQNRSPRTLQVYRQRLDTFVTVFGSRPVTTLQGSDMTTYFKRWSKAHTLLSHWETVMAYFNWLVRVGYIQENLLVNTIKRPVRPTKSMLIYTPEEVRWILQETMHTDQIGYWVLALFGGLRTYETERLQAHPVPWSQIDLRRGEITLDRELAPTGRRVIRILPVLRAWLKWIKQRALPFHPPNHWQKFRRVEKLVMGSRYIRLIAQGRVSPETRRPRSNAMPRRSYLAYRLAMAGSDLALAADECGLTERFLRLRYTQWASLLTSREYFSLTPDQVRRGALGPENKKQVHFQLKLKKFPVRSSGMPSGASLQIPPDSLVIAGDRPSGIVLFETQMVAFFVDAAELLGVPKSVAAIYGIVFASPEPLSFSDIESRLDFSKGSISQGLRALREIGAITEVSTEKDRTELFSPDLEMRRLIQRFLEQRLDTQLKQGKNRLGNLMKSLGVLTGSDQKLITERLQKLQRWHDRAIALMPVAKTFLKLTKI